MSKQFINEEWVEYKEFLQSHEMQLHSMGFPFNKLGEKLFYKLKYEIFEPDQFKIIDNCDLEKIYVQTNKDIKTEDNIFLIDHCWTFKVREFQKYVENHQNIIERIFQMLKYSSNKIPIGENSWKDKKIFEKIDEKVKFINEIDLKYNTQFDDLSENDLHNLSIINYDNLIQNDYYDLENIYISKRAYALSLETEFKINIDAFENLLINNKNIKIIWFNEKSFENNHEIEIFDRFSKITHLEMINRRLTKNISEFISLYLQNEFLPYYLKNNQRYEFSSESENICEKYLSKIKAFENIPNLIDFSSTQILILEKKIISNLLSFFKNDYKNNINCIDFSYNEFSGTEDEIILENLNSIFGEFKNIVKIIINIDVDSLYELNDDTYEIPHLIILLLKNFNSLKKITNLRYINDFEIDKIILKCGYPEDLQFKERFQYFLKSTHVYKNIWKISGSYRLITDEKYDENITWYINEEIGSYITLNQSDYPNMKIFPFIYSKSNDFYNDSITYSIMWPCRNIKKDEILTRDNLTNITEFQQRSSKLTLWCDTPKKYFRDMFLSKIEKLFKDEIEHSSNIKQHLDFVEQIKLKINKDLQKEEFNYLDYKDEIIKNYDFKRQLLLFEKKKYSKEKCDYLMNYSIKNIVSSFADFDFKNKSKITSLLINKNTIKVVSDLKYVIDNISFPFEITSDFNEADIVWLSENYYSINPLPMNLNDEENLKIKNYHFKNQFPYEAFLCMKSHLKELIQETKGFCNYYGLTYDLETELSAFIGNFYFNQEPYFYNKNSKTKESEIYTNNILLDNTWILKPTNMARSIDMIVSNNLNEIIKCSETGPKICQKYINNPYLMNGKKFDFRYMILVKSFAPVEIYIYTGVFWFRSANNNFTLDINSFTDYETHFTVMNYEKKEVMQQIFDYQFLAYLNEKNISYSEIFNKISFAIQEIFINTSYKCPQIVDPYSRAIYALDVMIDENLNPIILEFNYSPDCTRACKYTPSFFMDIFNTLFLNSPVNCIKISP